MSGTDTAERMRLHPDPPRVTRLSRKMLIGVGTIACLGIGGALIYALQAPKTAPGDEELYSTQNRTTADGLAELPSDYTGPELGPALPGDLGGPILKTQEQGKPVDLSAVPVPRVDPEEERRRTEEEAARLSGVFFEAGAETGNATASAARPGLTGLAGQPGLTDAQDEQRTFLDGPVDRQVVAPDRVTPPASPNILQAGSVIPAALITGIRSDLPGQIIAQVTEPVYDSPTGSILLIPQGTRLIGAYDDSVSFGQRRVLLVWNRLIFPDGSSIVLERLAGADSGGYAGLEDGVDYHWWDLMKAAGLSTLLAAGAEFATDDGDRLTRAIREGALDTINETGQQIVQRQLQVKPTLTIRPGFPVRIIVTKDLILESFGD
ncbi:TrbI/VirB10 family protein [Paracoccus onubensis]|uniref:TrbI/VirB10 family protein n=1 Tax=Paracoccus onubensis TaxID=1675788 RepID=UPI00272F3098|nr:TrbI/VirB10 family protein [Paracoccus onubensis]MDP0929702.1 TrbI/VirB10 family protein [Paracoccus onubensis]